MNGRLMQGGSYFAGIRFLPDWVWKPVADRPPSHLHLPHLEYLTSRQSRQASIPQSAVMSRSEQSAHGQRIQPLGSRPYHATAAQMTIRPLWALPRLQGHYGESKPNIIPVTSLSHSQSQPQQHR